MARARPNHLFLRASAVVEPPPRPGGVIGGKHAPKPRARAVLPLASRPRAPVSTHALCMQLTTQPEPCLLVRRYFCLVTVELWARKRHAPCPAAPSPPPRPDTVPPIAHGGSTLARPYASAFTTLAPASVTLTRQFVGTACRPFSCEEPRREAPRQLRQRHEGPPDGGPTMPQSPHTLPSHTHTHYHLNPSTTIHPAAGTAAPKLDATPSPLPSPPAPHDSRCKTVYGFVINAIVLLRGHSSPPRGQSRARAAGGQWRHPLCPD